MKTSDFYYELDEKLIAQTPIGQRDNSRLMRIDRKTGEINHKKFYEIVDEFLPGDCLILNDSKVLPARLIGKKEDTGAKIEFLLLMQKSDNIWEVLTKPGRKAKIGSRFVFNGGILRARVLEILDGGNRLVEFYYDGKFFDILDEIGQMPLPHYITKNLDDKDRYQTIYAKELGSAAAPTAGLHFTPSLIEKIRKKGVDIGFITLHVGLGTFRPVKADNISQHKMHTEHYKLPKETANLILKAKKNGGRVISGGTTTCRTLESVLQKKGQIMPDSGFTDIFIYPGYKFNVIDGLITNFHLPESTLIMLVSAFAGRENILQAYEVAMQEKYRFFSFGDCCFII
ncbi:MAG: tRNA preQ1(34) S-adenosylmethionine ribosyltransferase-isomerase QueA [Oscillospiraceae bacterium]|jgi:S-adenosylmethionine:tRNA ribosyltransferase-isomerase|nr:tRNA preQ1(34) S-adenosylmethionine ribosyltransferase-isomerase QueA [Oscillospiraceae bacterium]